MQCAVYYCDSTSPHFPTGCLQTFQDTSCCLANFEWPTPILHPGHGQITHPSLPTMHCYNQSARYFLMTKGTQLLVSWLQNSVSSSALTSGQQKYLCSSICSECTFANKIHFFTPSLIDINAAFRTISYKVSYNCMILLILRLYHMVRCIRSCLH